MTRHYHNDTDEKVEVTTEEFRRHAVPDRPLARAGRRVVEHAHPARCAGGDDALRAVPPKPGHRAQHADAAARRAGRGQAARAAPLQRAPAALRIPPDRARPRLPLGAGRAAGLGQPAFRARGRQRAHRRCRDRRPRRSGRAPPPLVAPAVSPARRVGTRPLRAQARAAPRMSIAASADAPTQAASAAALSPRTRLLLHGRIVPTLLRMAWPNVLVMLAQASTGLIETWWVSRLGLDALAGMALVFPGFMMMQMLSAGAMGGGISSSIARALGGGRRADADALVLHAVIVNLALGVLFSALVLAFGPSLYCALGGDGASLAAALQYSNVVFAGTALVWLMNALASVIRGTGNMMVPSLAVCLGVVLLVPLSPCLIFGVGPVPALGMAGAGAAVVFTTALTALALGWYLVSGRSLVRPRMARLRWAFFADILRVGAVGSVSTLQTTLTVALTTALVGAAAGPDAVAGYGTGARRIALVGGGLAFALSETIGLAAAIWPQAWLGLFGDDTRMLAAGTAYLRSVGPAYGFFGLGLSLYFASQGAGRLLWPLFAGLIRLVIAVGGGYVALRLSGSLGWVFAALAAGLVAYGMLLSSAIASGVWFRRAAIGRTP